ncbi:PCRF domain-containing protein [Candidatus Microgenomates bacterium]|nr:PCRF domain-containing protein [Candidatus Microgenomates bacterium]
MASNISAIILEIRPAAGGSEAKIWAQDLLRMYLRFAQNQGYKTQLLDEGVLKIAGSDAFEKLKFESGVHRVQRIPETEKRGRIHTSTATVAVLPEIPETEIHVRPEDCEWEFYRASSQGGQNVQKVSSAVRLHHKPTGVVVTCQTERDQWQNRQSALSLLRSKLWEKQEEEKEKTVAGYRSLIGRGMRAEKIRTFNFPQNRVTDHRINKSWHNLEQIVDGRLEPVVSTVTATLS